MKRYGENRDKVFSLEFYKQKRRLETTSKLTMAENFPEVKNNIHSFKKPN